MMRRTTFPLALVAVVALAAACTQEPISPGADVGTELTADELSFVATSLNDATGAAVGDLMAMGAAAGAPDDPGSGTHTFEFENTHACPEGGEVTVAGSGTFTRDGAAGTNQLDFEATKTITDCAFVRDDVTFTVNGDASLVIHVLVGMEGLIASERHLTGTITVVSSEGGTETCTFEIHSVFDPATGETVVTGEVCGNPIGGDETEG